MVTVGAAEMIEHAQQVRNPARHLGESVKELLVPGGSPLALGEHQDADAVISRASEADSVCFTADLSPDLGNGAAAVVERPDLFDKEIVDPGRESHSVTVPHTLSHLCAGSGSPS